MSDGEPDGEGWRDNHGSLPAAFAGKRMEVILNNGWRSGREPPASGTPGGWPVGGEGVKGAPDWRLKGPFGIARYRVIGG